MSRRFAIFGILLGTCFLSGCNARWKQQRELLEHENRQLENRIWELTFQLEAAQGELEYARKAAPTPGGTTPARAPSGLRGLLGVPPAELPATPPGLDLPPGLDAPTPAPASKGSEPSAPGAKKTSFGPELGSPLNPPQVEAPPLPSIPSFGPGGMSVQPAEAPASASSTNSGGQVGMITLHEKTGPRSVAAPGDSERLLVVVEPRTGSGKTIPLAGDIAVVVLDPSQNGQAARLARWDFSRQEVAVQLKASPPGEGIHLNLAWAVTPPAGRPLNLYVRYTSPEGKEMRAERQIRLPGHTAAVSTGPTKPVAAGDRPAWVPERK